MDYGYVRHPIIGATQVANFGSLIPTESCMSSEKSYSPSKLICCYDTTEPLATACRSASRLSRSSDSTNFWALVRLGENTFMARPLGKSPFVLLAVGLWILASSASLAKDDNLKALNQRIYKLYAKGIRRNRCIEGLLLIVEPKQKFISSAPDRMIPETAYYTIRQRQPSKRETDDYSAWGGARRRNERFSGDSMDH